MPQTNYAVSIPVTTTRTVTETKNVDVTLSDSVIGSIEDAKVLAAQLGAPAVTTEILALAMATRKSPSNVTTTFGKFFAGMGYNMVGNLAGKVANKYNRSLHSISAKFGGYGW